MSKLFNKKHINYAITFISIVYYIYLMFFSEVTLDTGKKELENMIMLALPCFMLLFYSFNVKDKEERKNILITYLIFYILAVIGFTFANFRDNVLIDAGISERGINLIPFSTIKQMLISPLGLRVALYNIMGNFLMLTPLAVLLPLIDDRFKKIRNYLIVIILCSLSIEVAQHITKIGSFDIDDLMLNVGGSFIIFLILTKTKLIKYLYKLFYEVNIPKKIVNVIYYILLTILFIIYVWYCSLVYIRYQEKKVDFSNLTCVENTKTYIGTIGRYNYYSECEFKGYVKRGNETIFLGDLINRFGTEIEKYTKELKLIKEEAITNIEVKLSPGTKKLIYDTDNHKKYLVDIERISYYKNGVECVIENSLPSSNEKDCSADLVTVTKSDLNRGYVISEGEYYNELSCVTGMYQDAKYIDYIVPKDYEFDANSSSKMP